MTQFEACDTQMKVDFAVTKSFKRGLWIGLVKGPFKEYIGVPRFMFQIFLDGILSVLVYLIMFVPLG